MDQPNYPPLELMFPVAAEIARQRWDDEADAYNKWPELGQDEKDELVKQVILEHLRKWKELSEQSNLVAVAYLFEEAKGILIDYLEGRL